MNRSGYIVAPVGDPFGLASCRVVRESKADRLARELLWLARHRGRVLSEYEARRIVAAWHG